MNQLSGIPTYVICILVSCILILACFIQKRTKEKITHSFILLQVSFIFYLTTTIVAELAEGHPEYRVLAFIANILTFLAIDIVFACFSIYLCCLVNKNYKPTLPIRIILCLLVIRSILVIALALTGTLFSINEAGQYVEEKLINVAYAFSACILVSLIAYGIVKRKNITKRELAVVLAYEIVPMVALIIETFTNLYILTGVSLTLSGLLIYVLIQDSEFEKSKVKQSMLEELSNTDLLTNLANRRAFYNTCEHLRPLENVGVMFCDINGLKYVNDHYGHTQGDFLIKKFSELAINAVGEKNIYIEYLVMNLSSLFNILNN